MSNFWKYFLFLLWLSYLLVCGVLLFSRGFLLSRREQREKSSCISNLYCAPSLNHLTSINSSHASHQDNLVDKCRSSGRTLPHQSVEAIEDICSEGRAKVVLLVIDALKYEFAASHKIKTKPYQNRLTVIQDLLEKKPDNARLYKFIADPPTTTMQRLKGMTTGSLPTFIDVGSNFASYEIKEDNLIDQLRSKGKNAVFMGDDTWSGLYPKRFIREYPYPSFNVWDLDTVDNGVKKHLIPEMKKNDWTLLIGHFLGVDHCGHRHGPFHPEMIRKLDEMNRVLRDVINALEDDSMLVVLGDHGMTNTGDHGGDSEDEVSAALFVYSPAGPGLLPKEWSPKGDSVNQIDLVPTLATILGVPIPFSNIGSIILDALPASTTLHHTVSVLPNWKYGLLSLWFNVRQAMNYIEKYAVNNHDFTSDNVETLSKMFNDLSHKMSEVTTEYEFVKTSKAGSEFLSSLRSMCERVWVQFDTFSLTWGLVFTVLVLMMMYLLIEALPGERLTFAASETYLKLAYSGMTLAAVVSFVLFFSGIVPHFDLPLYVSTFAVSFLVLAAIFAENAAAIFTKWSSLTCYKSWVDMFTRITCLFTLWAVGSNSYIVAESSVLCFFFMSLVAILVYSYQLPWDEVMSGSNKPKNDKSTFGWLKAQVHPLRLRLFIIAFSLCVLIRATHPFWRCRDGPEGCQQPVAENVAEPKRKSGLSADPNSLVMLVCIGLWVTVTRMWMRSCGNLTGYAPTVLFVRYVPTVIVVCSGGFWVLQGLPGATRSRLVKQWQLQLLPWTVYVLTAVSIVSLILRPLCVFVVVNRRQAASFSVQLNENPIPQLYNQMKQMISGSNQNGTSQPNCRPVVYGLATAYSASFTVVAIFTVLILAMLLGARLSLSIVLVACAAVMLLLLHSMLRFENALMSVQLLTTTWPAVVCWSLLAQYAFYATGHQPTFSAIQWDAAMVGTKWNLEGNKIFPAFLVILNTFGSHILMGFLLPVLLIAPLTLYVMLPSWASVPVGDQELAHGELMMFQREDFMYRSLTNLTARYIFLQGVRSMACMFSATIHARHLMAWGIFVPKFIFEAISLFVTLPCVLIAFMLVGRVSKCVGNLLDSLEPGKNSKVEKSTEKTTR